MAYEYWSWWAAFTWFLGALFGAIVNAYLWNMYRLKQQQLAQALKDNTDTTKRIELVKETEKAAAAMRAQAIDFARNASDFVMASNGVHKWESVPQMIFPIFGIVSSLIGSYQAWPSSL